MYVRMYVHVCLCVHIALLHYTLSHIYYCRENFFNVGIYYMYFIHNVGERRARRSRSRCSVHMRWAHRILYRYYNIIITCLNHNNIINAQARDTIFWSNNILYANTCVTYTVQQQHTRMYSRQVPTHVLHIIIIITKVKFIMIMLSLYISFNNVKFSFLVRFFNLCAETIQEKRVYTTRFSFDREYMKYLANI